MPSTIATSKSAGSTAFVPRWLPNLITVLRIALIPVLLILLLACDTSPGLQPWAVVTLVVLGGSDLVDGWLARRFGLGTPFGAFLDALADKLAQVALLAFFALGAGPEFAAVPVWFFVLVVGRDLVLGIGSLVVRARCGRVLVVHEVHGKLASLLIFGLLFWITAGLPEIVVLPAVVVITLLVGASTVAYFRAGMQQVSDTKG